MPNKVDDHGLVVSAADTKGRLKWTRQLHQHFVEAVTQLGGANSEFHLFDAMNLTKDRIAGLLMVSVLCLVSLCFGVSVLGLNNRGNSKTSDACHGDSRDNSLPFEEPFAGKKISLCS